MNEIRGGKEGKAEKEKKDKFLGNRKELQIKQYNNALHLRLNNGMSSKTPLQRKLQTCSPSGCRHVQWNLEKAVNQSNSFNDHSTVHTDVSDHCSASPQVSDVDSVEFIQDQKICIAYQQGYCSKGSRCQYLHADSIKKQTLVQILSQYPEQLIWGSRRMRSFMH